MLDPYDWLIDEVLRANEGDLFLKKHLCSVVEKGYTLEQAST